MTDDMGLIVARYGTSPLLTLSLSLTLALLQSRLSPCCLDRSTARPLLPYHCHSPVRAAQSQPASLTPLISVRITFIHFLLYAITIIIAFVALVVHSSFASLVRGFMFCCAHPQCNSPAERLVDSPMRDFARRAESLM